MRSRRDALTGYRVYDEADVRDALLTHQLRRGGYRLGQIAPLIAQVREAGGLEPLSWRRTSANANADETSAVASEVAWQSDHLDEEVVDLADRGDELVQVHRLGDIGVRVELVAAQDVLLGRGGGEDDDGDVDQVRSDLIFSST